MKRAFLFCAALASLQAIAAAQPGPAINGLRLTPRVFNDFTTTSLITANGNSVNQGPVLSTVTINETGWVNDGMGGNFANRHDVTLSPDAGVSTQVFDIADSFTFQVTLTLAVGSNAPRKEAGIRINSPVTGDGLFIINSDAGEIVAFGGGMPFKSFGSNGGGNGYTPGTPITLGITMRDNGAAPNTLEYFIDRGLGVESSGPLEITNLEGGPVNYSLGLYTQSAPDLSNVAEFVNTTFADIRYSATPIPEPTAFVLGVAAMIGLAGVRRR